MATFAPIYFTWTTRYPDSGLRVVFGNSYNYTAGPTAPDQRVFLLKLQAMQYFLQPDGVTLNTVTEPVRNLAALEAFYQEHKLHKAFDFNHPVYGLLSVKFNRPLEIPEGIPGGNGVYELIEVELLEQP